MRAEGLVAVKDAVLISRIVNDESQEFVWSTTNGLGQHVNVYTIAEFTGQAWYISFRMGKRGPVKHVGTHCPTPGILAHETAVRAANRNPVR